MLKLASSIVKKFNLKLKNIMEPAAAEAFNVEKKSLNDTEEPTSNKKIKVENSNEHDLNIETKNEPKDDNKVKKRKYALLIGYCGEGYFGLQRLYMFIYIPIFNLFLILSN